MAIWTFYDYIELTKRNPIRRWLDGLSDGARGKIDVRLLQMSGMTRWPEGWVSKYHGTEEIFELRIIHSNVQYRPLGTYFGEKQFILLNGAVEKGKIPKSDIEVAQTRLQAIRKDSRHVHFHEYDPDTLEEDEEKSIP
jgi:hypothetical protein